MTPHPAPASRLPAPRLLFVLFPLLTVGFGWFLFLDYRGTERELRRLLEANAFTLAESLARTAAFSLESYELLQDETVERLTASARLVAHLEAEGRLKAAELGALAESLGLFRVHVVDRAGRLVMASHPPAGGAAAPRDLGPDVLGPLLAGQVAELVLGFRDSRFGDGKRFAVAVRRPGGGAVVVNIDAARLDGYRRQAGLGHAVAALAANPDIAYLVIQDEEGPVSVSPGVTAVESFDEDPELRRVLESGRRQARFVERDGREVLEAVVPLELRGDYPTVFRLGMNLDFYRDQIQALQRREILAGVAFVLVSGLLVGLLTAVQNYRYLHSRYQQTLALSGHITEHMAEALLVVDDAGRVVRRNRKAAERFAAVEGKPLPPELTGALADAAGDGLLRWADALYQVHRQDLPAGEGVPAGSLSLILLRDVTAQRALEAQLERDRRLAAVGRTLAAVTHEIRNPLNALSMSVQTLQRRLKDTADTRSQDTLAVIREEIHRLDTLIEEFLVFARPPAAARRPVPVAELLDRLRELFAAGATAQGAALDVALAPSADGLSVRADPEGLFRVLVNLVKNSLEALAGPGTVRVIADRSADGAVLTVHDTGPGFSPEALQRGVEPFFTTRPGGTGLGLSISAEVARAHGWRLELANDSAGGGVVNILIEEGDLA